MRVHVDEDRCIASGLCALAATAVFAQDEDGVVTLLTDTPAPADRAGVRTAADGCPGRAIAVVDDHAADHRT